ncbi:AAA family ATPase [Sinorhizobium fredii]|uniref:AAA family ATPase n=1 Tax=Rhizobium fredii TaxID=380 RepID=UPI0004B72BF5|nr:AAA family ATPase [Sinorhizobium fredii]AWI59025.1 hypothetical protein AB395_00003389 [Sinorhizobium fredii CCBAU 45436]
MDPVRNPYAPGAGTPPPELAGRADVINAATVCLQRIAQGKPTQSLIMVGLRGVGKTVLLNKIKTIASEENFETAFIEAHEGKSLPELLVPSLRSLLFKLSTLESAKDKARKGIRILKSFLGGLKVTFNDIEIGLSMDPETGTADSGDLEADLPELIIAVGEAAKAAGKPIALLLDELQYLSETEFSALIMSIHRINQESLPLVLVGAGLPQILGLAGNSKSYAERLFRYPEIGALDKTDAVAAIVHPARQEGVDIEEDALDKILNLTERYPYFLQQWAYESWNVAEQPKITLDAVDRATALAIKELDQSFFKVRFDRCTPSEKRYMRALAEFGHGKHRSGDIAEKLGVKTTSVAPTRSALIRKGMIYSPSHGDTAFTVPLFDQYMRRVMPTL